MRFTRVRFHRNPSKDRARREARARAAAAGVAVGADIRLASAAAAPRPLVAADPIPACDNNAVATFDASNASGGPGLVLQHGIWSGACTWQRMEGWLAAENFRFGSRVKINTPSTAGYAEQALALETAVRGVGGRDFIFVGHSNGGIVSRRAARDLQRYGGPSVQGVITIGSPHRGAPAMRVPLVLAVRTFHIFSAPLRALCAPVRRRGCGDGERLSLDDAEIRWLYRVQLGQVGIDMIPGSPFLKTLGSTTDPFRKVGIVSYAPDKWQWARLYGDRRCYPEDRECGGNIVATRTNRYYKHLAKTAILSSLLSVGAIVIGADPTRYIATAATTAIALGIMKGLDLLWRRIVSQSEDASDGIVPASSQIYPAYNSLYQIPGADSHNGSTRSFWVRDRLMTALRLDFGVAR